MGTEEKREREPAAKGGGDQFKSKGGGTQEHEKTEGESKLQLETARKEKAKNRTFGNKRTHNKTVAGNRALRCRDGDPMGRRTPQTKDSNKGKEQGNRTKHDQIRQLQKGLKKGSITI